MSRIAYLDCPAGISGDMLLGALIDVGWPEQSLRELISKLKLGDVELKVDRVSKRGISATQVNILSSPTSTAQRPARSFVNCDAGGIARRDSAARNFCAPITGGSRKPGARRASRSNSLSRSRRGGHHR